ncbi:MAG: hypothetical protein KAJ73_05990 [Zetaproteobacteria bacterium]|nr:hypothetical protein [Zetaproteobacteria bacterium]
MSNKVSFIKLENQFEDAMATVSSIYELMQNTGAGSSYTQETFRKIGHAGLNSTKKAEEAFRALMELYLDEQQEIKRYTVEPKKPSKDPMVERAVNLVKSTQVKHTKQ